MRRPAIVLRSRLALAALVLATGAARAEVFFDTVEVTLVNVEVWARDDAGDPVTGLTAEDFQVRHDGEPVEISHFAEIRAGRSVTGRLVPGRPAAEAGDAGGEAAESPHLVLYFDQLRLHPTSYGPLIEDLKAFIKRGDVDPERVLILRQDRNLYVEASFGSSERELTKVLSDLQVSASRSVGLDNSSERALAEIKSAWDEAESLSGTRSGALAAIPTVPGLGNDSITPSSPRTAVGGAGTNLFGSDSESCDIFLGRIEPIVESWTHEKSQRLAVSVDHLTQAGTFLAGVSGVKTFLYLSDGLETQPASAFASYIGKLCPSGQSSVMLSAATEELSRSILRLTRHFNSNRITMYSLQGGGLKAPAYMSSSRGGGLRGGSGARAINAFESAQRTSDRGGLSLLARETGGRAVFDQNSLIEDLEDIGRDMGTYYSLAYELPPDSDRDEHRIEVDVPGRKITTRYRRGHLAKDPSEWMAERLEGALNLGLVSNPLGIGLGAGNIRPAEDGGSIIPLHVFLPVAELGFIDQGEGELAQVTVEVLARHLGSDQLVSLERRQRVPRPAAGQAKTGVALELALVPGDHTIAVGVRDEIGRRSSFVSTTVRIDGQ